MIECEERWRKGGYIVLTRCNGVNKEEGKKKREKEGFDPSLYMMWA